MKTPAEERTGVSDTQAAILGEVVALRRHLDSSMPTWRRMDHRIADGLDRIEQWTRGDAR